jgi:hypothetical protein
LACHFLTSCKRGCLLLDFHGLAAAGDGARAALGDNHLGAAFGAAISLAYRISHILSPLCVILSFLIIVMEGDYCQKGLWLWGRLYFACQPLPEILQSLPPAKTLCGGQVTPSE